MQLTLPILLRQHSYKTKTVLSFCLGVLQSNFFLRLLFHRSTTSFSLSSIQKPYIDFFFKVSVILPTFIVLKWKKACCTLHCLEWSHCVKQQVLMVWGYQKEGVGVRGLHGVVQWRWQSLNSYFPLVSNRQCNVKPRSQESIITNTSG